MVRVGSFDDIDKIVQLLTLFHSESSFNNIPVDVVILQNKIKQYISHPDVIVLVDSNDNQINGLLIAYVSAFFFSNSIGAWDVAFYFAPNDRGGAAPFRMINEYIRWAKMRNAQRIFLGTAAAANPDRVGKFYRSCGFENVGGVFCYDNSNE